MTYKVEGIAREAENAPWEFTFDGETYVLPSDFDMRAAAALSAGRLEDGLRILMGPDQWERLCASPLTFGIKALTDMLTAYGEAIGVDLGEFQASPPSSKSTVTPSRRTSNGSTKSRSRTSSKAR